MKEIIKLLFVNWIIKYDFIYPFIYKAGNRNPFYFDFRRSLFFPSLFRLIVGKTYETFKDLFDDEIDAFTAAPLGGIPGGAILAAKTKKKLIVEFEEGYRVYSYHDRSNLRSNPSSDSILATPRILADAAVVAEDEKKRLGFIRIKEKGHGIPGKIVFDPELFKKVTVFYTEDDISREDLITLLDEYGIDYSLQKVTLGNNIWDKQAIIDAFPKIACIEDVVSKGGSSIKACSGLGVKIVISWYSHEAPSKEEAFKEHGIVHYPLFTYNDVLQYLEEDDSFEDKTLLEKMKDWNPDTWGEENGFPAVTTDRKKAKPYLCHALDGLTTLDDVFHRIKLIAPYMGMVKIGKGAFTRFGTEVVKLCNSLNLSIFLDLKYHDTPGTVMDAIDAAVQHNVAIINIHIAGGHEMMKLAKQALDNAIQKYKPSRVPKLIGVTVLTSLDLAGILWNNYTDYLHFFKQGGANNLMIDRFADFDYPRYIELKQMGESIADEESPNLLQTLEAEFAYLRKELDLDRFVIKKVHHRSKMSLRGNLHGIVCSAADVNSMPLDVLKKEGFKFATPGIKNPTLQKGGMGQKRVTTPYNVMQDASEHNLDLTMVVGSAVSKPLTPEQKKTGIPVTDRMIQEACAVVADDTARALA